MSMPLYLKGLREMRMTLLILLSVVLMYFSMIIPMFDPKLGSILAELIKAMPEIMGMVGMGGVTDHLIEFIASYLYGFIMLVFPLVFSILVVNQLVSRNIENGSMLNLLAAPVSRKTVIRTQMAVLVTGLFIMIGIVTLVGFGISAIVFPNQLDIFEFMILNGSVFILQVFIGGLLFMSACIFSESKTAMGVGAGIVVVSLLLQMASNVGETLGFIKYITFFTLFDPTLLHDNLSKGLAGIGVLLVGVVVTYSISIQVFSNRDFHI